MAFLEEVRLLISLWTTSGFISTTESAFSLPLITLPLHLTFICLQTLEFTNAVKIVTVKMMLMKGDLLAGSFALI